jgi:hypothetical protein
LATIAIAGQAHADTVVRFMPKTGIPYTVQREEPRIEHRNSVHHAVPHNDRQHYVSTGSHNRRVHHKKSTSVNRISR